MKTQYKITALPFHTNRANIIAVFFIIWGITLSTIPNTLVILTDYFSFFFLGILGATFANATGAGGGVVFIPMFNQLGFSEAQAVATSFTIQCFGMSAGAIAWYSHYQKERKTDSNWQAFWPIITLATIASILGLWTTYGLNLNSPASLHESFSLFSIFLGVCILASVYLINAGHVQKKLRPLDIIALAAISYVGGLITAWLSVGVGELVAIYLIVRRYEVTLAVATAVVISAFTVWASTPQHWFIAPEYYWQVILFAGPGAVIGGFVARKLVAALSARRLKIFFALWILIVGISTSSIPRYIHTLFQ
ncbi:sulfite exporter TauE/SafE family protein [Algibacillus agarilyticus]|uniref:sulfite exporter TauE/SafE family protein n=1 Tax=Algibacillus agarilyticus TaxID=2234133 RepID=UPI001E2E81C7|nr:sulfite exporter TauE/SafE family protein [Algibacillus agarilyticus]